MTVAALYVERGGVYWDLPGVDPWDEERDARLYPGPHPVAAHPPCARWCMLAGLVQKRYGYKKGDDGGCFAAALAAVRAWGGVLEHPAFSAAFAAYGIPEPVGRGWQRTMDGGYVTFVEQFNYGHDAKKATWLYAYGTTPPALDWSRVPDDASPAYVTDGGGDIKRRRRKMLSFCRNHGGGSDDRKRLGGKAASRTPIPFRNLLLSIARSVRSSVPRNLGTQQGGGNQDRP